MTAAAAERRRDGRGDAVIVGVVFGLLYLAAGQHTMWGVDPWMDLRWVSEGQIASPTHALYLPAVHFVWQLGDALGLSLHQSARAMSAIGTGVGVAFMLAASRRLGMSRMGSLLVAALIGFAPGVAFYATVVERHGPFFGCAGAVCFVTAGWIRGIERSGVRDLHASRRDRFWLGQVGWALLLGGAVGLAFAMHSTGSWLVCLVAGVSFASFRSMGVGVGVACTMVALGVVASALAIALVTRVATWAGVLIVEGGSLEFFLMHARAHVSKLAALPVCVWREFVFALLPISLLAWCGFVGRDAHGRSLCGRSAAVVCVALVYVVLTFLILGDYEERGAYTLPLAWPLAHLTVLACSRQIVTLGVVVACVSASLTISHHDTRPHAQTAAALRAADPSARPCLLPATRADFELLFLEFPEYRGLHDYLDMFQAAHTDDLEGGRAVLPIAMAWVSQALQSGRTVWISEGAFAFLDAPPRVAHPELGPEFAMALRRTFRLESSGIGTYMRLTAR